MTMLPILLAAAMAFPDGKRCAVTYTFDDGLADQYEVAFPMFRNAGLQATFFPITDKVGDPKGLMSHGMKRGYDAWESPEELKKHLEWVKAQPDVWVGTFGEVAARRAAHPAATSSAKVVRPGLLVIFS